MCILHKSWNYSTQISTTITTPQHQKQHSVLCTTAAQLQPNHWHYQHQHLAALKHKQFILSTISSFLSSPCSSSLTPLAVSWDRKQEILMWQAELAVVFFFFFFKRKSRAAVTHQLERNGTGWRFVLFLSTWYDKHICYAKYIALLHAGD